MGPRGSPPPASRGRTRVRGHDRRSRSRRRHDSSVARALRRAAAAASSNLPPAPCARHAPAPRPPPPPPTLVAGATPAAAPHDWKKMAKAEVNPQWFWRVVMGVAGLAVLILAIVGIRAAMASRPSVKRDASFEQEVRERQAALKEGQALFAAGKYEESLVKLRQVLLKSPNNEEARKYAQMAENAIATRQDEERKKLEAGRALEAARAALSEGRFDEAKGKADEALAADASNADAPAIRDEADRKIAE